jgi:hypothetical protein
LLAEGLVFLAPLPFPLALSLSFGSGLGPLGGGGGEDSFGGPPAVVLVFVFSSSLSSPLEAPAEVFLRLFFTASEKQIEEGGEERGRGSE